PYPAQDDLSNRTLAHVPLPSKSASADAPVRFHTGEAGPQLGTSQSGRELSWMFTGCCRKMLLRIREKFSAATATTPFVHAARIVAGGFGCLPAYSSCTR